MAILAYDFLSTEQRQNRITRQLSATLGDAVQVVLYDSSGNEIQIGAATALVTGTKTVTTAGTAVRITATPTACKGVWVSADIGAGIICVIGDSSVLATAGSMQGIVIVPGNQATYIPVSDLSLLWVDAMANAGKIAYCYLA